MGFLSGLFGKKETVGPLTYAEFWHWFQDHEKSFHAVIRKNGDIEKGFFEKISPKLDAIRPGYFYVAGMQDASTAEFIITADGDVRNFVFVEDLVAAAPSMPGWTFTALKPEISGEGFTIGMGGHNISAQNLSFYAVQDPAYPDEVDIRVVYDGLTNDNRKEIENAVWIFLDNYLGELGFATRIDHLEVIGRDAAEDELIPMVKLGDYLRWREKEFVEKYEGLRKDTAKDSFVVLEGKMANGMPMIASMNEALLAWEGKPSHPWMLTVGCSYEGNEQGMPGKETFELIGQLGEELEDALKDREGYLHVGRTVGNGRRKFYIACREFRQSSRVADALCRKYAPQLNLDYNFIRDKYWMTLRPYIK